MSAYVGIIEQRGPMGVDGYDKRGRSRIGDGCATMRTMLSACMADFRSYIRDLRTHSPTRFKRCPYMVRNEANNTKPNRKRGKPMITGTRNVKRHDSAGTIKCRMKAMPTHHVARM